MPKNNVEYQVKRLEQWRGLYDSEYIRQHFIVDNDDGDAEALIDEIVHLRKRLKNQGGR